MTNKSTLQYPNNTQFMVTVPKGLVLAKGWKRGDRIEFIINVNIFKRSTLIPAILAAV
jgi:bifunctional DNA-binding transcriptional regulator/antitoxin component of YhaV-PrlF toxin-antitoxin module